MMRPSIGIDESLPRSRKSSTSDGGRPPADRLTTFFLTREPDFNSAGRESDTSSPGRNKECVDDTTYHVKGNTVKRSISRRRSTIRPNTGRDCRDITITPHNEEISTTRGILTPCLLSSREGSTPSSPKSLSSQSIHKSDDDLIPDEDDTEAIMSGGEEQVTASMSDTQDSAPQLIMPSIKMPSRRPFTQRGKEMGRYKILIAGSRGSGRTSLIKSIVQLCSDIVHVDSTTSVATLPPGKSEQNTAIQEIYASTKPYPAWWSELDEGRILKRRKSMGDMVLERNICFVDTTNHGKPDKVLHYLEQQASKTLRSTNSIGNDLIDLISGKGGCQVDVVLFLITKGTLKADLENIRQIGKLSNVVPLIARADTLSAEDISELKMATSTTGISIPHLPTLHKTNEGHGTQAHAPYTVSSANGPDFDNMDASLLMSPEYVQPLLPSELTLLVEQLFESNTINYLRHTAAKKLAAWLASEPQTNRVLLSSLSSPDVSAHHSPLHTSLSRSGVLVPVASELSLNTSNSYILAKLGDHTQREEHLAQIRLCKWAADLQLSMQRERERYENIARKERAVWLVQRMGEEIRGGKVMDLDTTSNRMMIKASNTETTVPLRSATWDVYDPMGLLHMQNVVRSQGWIALQIVGSFGVVSGVALWLARTWGFTSSLHDWAHEWSENWFGND